MKSIASMFFAIGAVFALVGMIWGIQMSASQDHTLSPAHGHLNLLGFAAMSLFGSYYALSPQAAAAGLAKLHLGLATLSVIVLVPGIVMAITERGEGLAKSGSVLAVLSMLLFLVIVLRHPIGQRHS
jgi:cbb3-type cytochrome oxidase subunit 1